MQWDDTQPVLLQPCGAVPKGSVPFYRLITDARFGNMMYRDSDWGVTCSRVHLRYSIFWHNPCSRAASELCSSSVV